MLVELCRPVLGGDLFTEPASIRRVVPALAMTDAAVKQHLLPLHEMLGVYDEPTCRRRNLADEAVRRGAVTVANARPTQ